MSDKQTLTHIPLTRPDSSKATLSDYSTIDLASVDHPAVLRAAYPR
ncbi:hypothetical protein ACVBEF_04365 [Glaciimonas sp. GG7]